MTKDHESGTMACCSHAPSDHKPTKIYGDDDRWHDCCSKCYELGLSDWRHHITYAVRLSAPAPCVKYTDADEPCANVALYEVSTYAPAGGWHDWTSRRLCADHAPRRAAVVADRALHPTPAKEGESE